MIPYLFPDVMVCLRHYVNGRSWHRLTACCQSMRRYSWMNPRLKVYAYYFRPAEIPPGVTHLSMYDRDLEKHDIPDTVISLRVWHLTGQEKTNPSLWKIHGCSRRLRHLTLVRTYLTDIRSLVLPEKLISLKFGHGFNESLDGWRLPETLEVLKLGNSFRQPIDGLILPKRLRKSDIAGIKLSVPSSLRCKAWM